MTQSTVGLTFNDIISTRTCYGLIWSGSYHDKPCVIKMIMLDSGIHYDKTKRKYLNSLNTSKLDLNKGLPSVFNRDENIPFLHTHFKHRRSMSLNDYLHEAEQMNALSKYGLAPRVYAFFTDTSHPIHYAFLVMQRIDASVKDILVKRPLNLHEEQIIEETVNKLHQKLGIVHGDMKPSNIGIFLDQKGQIKSACFFDCQKIRHLKDIDYHERDKLTQRDWNNYRKHTVKNREIDSKDQTQINPAYDHLIEKQHDHGKSPDKKHKDKKHKDKKHKKHEK